MYIVQLIRLIKKISLLNTFLRTSFNIIYHSHLHIFLINIYVIYCVKLTISKCIFILFTFILCVSILKSICKLNCHFVFHYIFYNYKSIILPTTLYIYMHIIQCLYSNNIIRKINLSYQIKFSKKKKSTRREELL